MSLPSPHASLSDLLSYAHNNNIKTSSTTSKSPAKHHGSWSGAGSHYEMQQQQHQLQQQQRRQMQMKQPPPLVSVGHRRKSTGEMESDQKMEYYASLQQTSSGNMLPPVPIPMQVQQPSHSRHGQGPFGSGGANASVTHMKNPSLNSSGHHHSMSVLNHSGHSLRAGGGGSPMMMHHQQTQQSIPIPSISSSVSNIINPFDDPALIGDLKTPILLTQQRRSYEHGILHQPHPLHSQSPRATSTGSIPASPKATSISQPYSANNRNMEYVQMQAQSPSLSINTPTRPGTAPIMANINNVRLSEVNAIATSSPTNAGNSNTNPFSQFDPLSNESSSERRPATVPSNSIRGGQSQSSSASTALPTHRQAHTLDTASLADIAAALSTLKPQKIDDDDKDKVHVLESKRNHMITLGGKPKESTGTKKSHRRFLSHQFSKKKHNDNEDTSAGGVGGDGDGDGDGDETGNNNSHILFDLNEAEYKDRKPYEEPNLYYRADDDQRTIMSGQALLRGLFGDLIQQHSEELGTLVDPTIIVHTADRVRDILSPNKAVCPRLSDLYEEATQSQDYVHQYVNSNESKLLNQFMEENFGGDFRDQAQDCLMTTICNDRELPQLLDDYSRGGDDYFERLTKYSFQPYTYVLRHNDAAYSKLALGPLWMNILSNMIPNFPIDAWKELIPELEIGMKESSPKLALVSGHDGTLLPLLATLGEDVYNGEDWSPYASMILIELYSVDGDENIYPTSRAFRVVYNGDILTDKIEGCTQNVELCDITHLLRRVAPFTTNKRDCDSKLDEPPPPTASLKDALSGSWRGIATLMTIILGSCAVGSIVTFGLMTGRLRCILFNIIPDRFRPYKKANSQNHGDSLTNYSLQQKEHGHDLNLEESTLDYGSANSSLRPNENAVAT
mmetsp:Transcript_17336/g.26166  ORF Transcript_17336/g.26166 Transcript_17336/m.26166 type:complete len:900 (+) Transcript_17336:1013-3712(+)